MSDTTKRKKHAVLTVTVYDDASVCVDQERGLSSLETTTWWAALDAVQVFNEKMPRLIKIEKVEA